MKHSDLTSLKAVADSKKLNLYEVLITLKNSNVEIYTINSSAKKIAYDYIETSHYSDDGIDDEVRVDIVAPGIEEKSFAQGEIIPVGKDILFELAVNRRASEAQMFSSGNKEHKMSSKSARDNRFKLMTYDDLYVYKDDLKNVAILFKSQPSKRSSRKKEQHIVAIEDALAAGKVENEDIYDYIKNQTENYGAYIYLDFVDDDITPLNLAEDTEIVMKVNNKGIKKKRLQNIIWEIKKKN